jgi:hypothetical protein
LVVAVAVLASLPPAHSSQEGTWEARERGCYCHGSVAAPTVGFSLDGLPGRYAPGQAYTVWINVTFTDVPAVQNGSQGGVYIEATDGTFAAPSATGEPLIQVNGSAASHTLEGSMVRRWVVQWTAPDTPGLVVTFWVFVNTVNGNERETLGSDHWTMKTVRIGVGDEPEVTGPPQPVQRLALETYGALVLAIAAAAVAFYYLASNARASRQGAPREGSPPDEPDEGPPPP